MKYRFLALLFVVFALAVVGLAEAQPNSQDATSNELTIDALDRPTDGDASVLQCQDSLQAMSACRSFIKGFIQGALLTDTAIIKSIEDTEPTFAERAFRTRLGSRSNRPATALAGFCLPPDKTILQLAEETLEHVKHAQRNSEQLAKEVYQSLKVDYPCAD